MEQFSDVAGNKCLILDDENPFSLKLRVWQH
jgi:hypothetical protein